MSHSSHTSNIFPIMRPAFRTLVVILAFAVAGGASYTVRPGDTLIAIAGRLGTTVRALVDANDLTDPDRIFAGRTLRLPTSASGGEGSAQAAHVVRPGETLSGIAARYRVSATALAEANGIDDPDHVIAGRRLRIPVTGAAASAPVPPASLARADVEALLERTARRYEWNPAFVKALAWQESGWNPATQSHAGAIGVMQVLPDTGRFVSGLVGRPLDLADPADNIEAGVAFLDYLHDLVDGDAEQILAGYYQGLASVRRNGLYADTRRYIANVLALRERFR